MLNKGSAIVSTGISRWHNFYVEGLNWLTKNVGIDGVYIDDLAFDRNTMKRTAGYWKVTVPIRASMSIQPISSIRRRLHQQHIPLHGTHALPRPPLVWRIL